MTQTLSIEEEVCRNDTWKHIRRVGGLLLECSRDLSKRAFEHDQSKLESPELELFAAHNANLAGFTYGTPEFEENKKKLKTALDHHYARNRHHPEFHKNGINDMNLLDLIEMLVDWKASSERHNDGNIRKSIEVNANTFGISPQLVRILENTVRDLDIGE
jgi:hypothetical protein